MFRLSKDQDISIYVRRNGSYQIKIYDNWGGGAGSLFIPILGAIFHPIIWTKLVLRKI